MSTEVIFTTRLISRIVNNKNWVHITFISGNEMIYYTKNNNNPFQYIKESNNVETILIDKYIKSEYNSEMNHEIVRDQILPKPQLR
jgi:hypothetical protein